MLRDEELTVRSRLGFIGLGYLDSRVARRVVARSTANQYVRIVREFAKDFEKAPDQLGPDDGFDGLLHGAGGVVDHSSSCVRQYGTDRTTLSFMLAESTAPGGNSHFLSPTQTPLHFAKDHYSAPHQEVQNRRPTWMPYRWETGKFMFVQIAPAPRFCGSHQPGGAGRLCRFLFHCSQHSAFIRQGTCRRQILI